MDRELTPEEQACLQTITKEQETPVDTYDFDKPFQQELLGLVLSDAYFRSQALSLIKPEFFQDKAHSTIFRIAFELLERFPHEPPRYEVLVTELKSRFATSPVLGYFLAELSACLRAYTPGLESRQYILSQITEFARHQSLKIAIIKTIDLMKIKDKFGEITDLLRNALLITPNTDLGLNYFEDIESRYERMTREDAKKDRFSCGFGCLDDLIVGGGLSRGEMGAFMGMPGTGKSVALTQASVHNIMRGKKVLYVSLEMDSDKVAQRFDTMFTTIPISELKMRRREVSRKIEQEIWQNIVETAKQIRNETCDRNILRIKQFPAGTADVTTIRAYMSQLSLQGFRPDLVIVDYVGELKDYPGIKTYESRQRLVRDLRALAVEEQMCVLTALQPNRSGREAQEDGSCIDDAEIGDSFGQARVLDAIWSLNQDRAEKKANVGRLFVAKNRNGPSRETFYYRQDRYTLGMSEINNGAYRQLISDFEKDQIENVPVKKFKPNS